MTTRLTDPNSAAVPRATQADSIQPRWCWVEPAVWTERMLTALEQGVKGGVWFSLIDKVYRVSCLTAGFACVHANRGAAGVDHVSVHEFAAHEAQNLEQLSQELRTGTYQPQAVRRVYIPKPDGTQRPLGIPMVRAYCTPYQKPWGSIPHRFGGGEVAVCFLPRPPQASIASAAHLDDLFFQRRGTGFRNRVMSSGVSRTHHGPWGAACMPSRRPD